MSDFFYSDRRPPVMCVDRKVKFVCLICKKPGWGSWNAKVHRGECREALRKQIAARTNARAKAKKERAALPATA